MISVTEGSSSNRCKGPWPSTSSPTSRKQPLTLFVGQGRRLLLDYLGKLVTHECVELLLTQRRIIEARANPGVQGGGGAIFQLGQSIGWRKRSLTLRGFPPAAGAAPSLVAVPRAASSRWDSFTSHPPPPQHDAARACRSAAPVLDRSGRPAAAALSRCDRDQDSAAEEPRFVDRATAFERLRTTSAGSPIVFWMS